MAAIFGYLIILLSSLNIYNKIWCVMQEHDETMLMNGEFGFDAYSLGPCIWGFMNHPFLEKKRATAIGVYYMRSCITL